MYVRLGSAIDSAKSATAATPRSSQGCLSENMSWLEVCSGEQGGHPGHPNIVVEKPLPLTKNGATRNTAHAACITRFISTRGTPLWRTTVTDQTLPHWRSGNHHRNLTLHEKKSLGWLIAAEVSGPEETKMDIASCCDT